MKNPYPKDVFKWDNPEELDFNRGRFNQHCFEVFENCREDVVRIIEKKIKELDEKAFKHCFKSGKMCEECWERKRPLMNLKNEIAVLTDEVKHGN